MGEQLITGWTSVPLPSALSKEKFQVGKVKLTDYKASGRYPIIDQGQSAIAGYWDDEKDLYRGPLPVVIFGDHTRTLKFVVEPFVCGADGTKVLLPNLDLFDPEFFFFALSDVELPARGYNRHFSLLRETSLPCPPVPEQRSISSVLGATERAKGATAKVVAATLKLRRSLVQHLFTYGPIPISSAESVALKESELGPIPTDWGVGAFHDLVTIQSGMIDPRLPEYRGLVHVGPENIEPETGRLLSGRTAEDLGLISGKYLFTERDVLYSKIRPYLRKVALPTFKGLCSADMYPLLPANEGLVREFLFHYLLSERFSQQAISFQDRTGIPKINRQQLGLIPVPVPPREQQIAIADMLSSLDQKIVTETKKLDSLSECLDSSLHELMTGARRVAPAGVA